jgi:hypothetical protein
MYDIFRNYHKYFPRSHAADIRLNFNLILTEIFSISRSYKCHFQYIKCLHLSKVSFLITIGSRTKVVSLTYATSFDFK